MDMGWFEAVLFTPYSMVIETPDKLLQHLLEGLNICMSSFLEKYMF